MKARSKNGTFAPGLAAAARAAGLSRYVSDRPCPAGHIGERFVSNNGCVECLRNSCRKYHFSHHARSKQRLREYARRDPGANRERSAAVRYKGTRVPKWADRKAIQDFYRHCPEGMTVDHIIPLKGKTVSGLHVLENLKYVTPIENSKKGVKWNG